MIEFDPQDYLTGLISQTVDENGKWSLKDKFPTIPLTFNGIPQPGPDFIRKASDLAGNRPLLVSAYLETLYSLALYQDWFSMDVLVKGLLRPVRFIPGHIWSSNKADGPWQQADIMIIGKMPGKEEVREGRNLFGPSGIILHEAFKSVGCPPEVFMNAYVTNVMRFGHPMPHLGGAISQSWIKDCSPLLKMELMLVKPKFILCLGSEAGKELLGMKGKVNASVGKVFDYEIPLLDGTTHTAKLMTCIHSAAVARAPDLRPQLESTLRLFTGLIEGKRIGEIETDLDHRVARTEEEALQCLDFMIEETKDGGAIAIDCEWHGEQPKEPGSWLRTIQVSHKPKFALCLVLRKCGGIPALCDYPSVREKLKLLFNRPYIRAIGHFHRADLPWMIEYGVDLRKNFEVPADPINGWILTKTEGGFDTGMSAHSVCETDDYKLEVQATRLTGVHRYDSDLQKAKKKLCEQLKVSDLDGYGYIPDEVLEPYSLYDVDVTRRLFDVYNGIDDKPGLLDCDEFGNNSRIPFWISMRASPACLEMEQTGMLVDMTRAEKLVDTYRVVMSRKLTELKDLICWQSFNINSPFDCRELLFGVKYRGQTDKDTQQLKRASPQEARLCNLVPIKTTNKNVRKSWQDLERSGEAYMHTPAADRETLGILFHATKDAEVGKVVERLRDLRFLGQVLKTTLKPPSQKDGKDIVDEDGHRVYEKGLLSYVCKDSRIRTHIFQTLETGRYASARPNLMNLSSRREADLARIVAEQYLYPVKSMVVASPGHVIISADYIGAELCGMAWMSQDETMLEHVRRAQLPENHPDYYDIHSSVAVAAFRLTCAPTKEGLKSVGKSQLRVAAKNVVFGFAYGRGAAAICQQAKEEGVNITVEDAQALIDGLIRLYPRLPIFFNQCRQRTHNQMYLVTCFGRYRRFRNTVDRKSDGEQERAAQNMPIQSLVSDAVSRALDHLYSWPNRRFKILLQIHDDIVLEVPIEDAEYVYDTVLPECMTNRVNIRPCDLDGMPLNDKIYHLGIDMKVSTKWALSITDPEEAKQKGIPLRFVKGKK